MASEKDEAASQAEQAAYAEALQKQIDELIHPSTAPAAERAQSLRDIAEQMAREAEAKPIRRTPKRKRQRKKGKP
jgi:hypothetical protein